MRSSSAARVLDPLEAPEATFLDTGVSIVATMPRSERIAPDVTAVAAPEAVAIVRAGGFIAAIEPVAPRCRSMPSRVPCRSLAR